MERHENADLCEPSASDCGCFIIGTDHGVHVADYDGERNGTSNDDQCGVPLFILRVWSNPWVAHNGSDRPVQRGKILLCQWGCGQIPGFGAHDPWYAAAARLSNLFNDGVRWLERCEHC